MDEVVRTKDRTGTNRYEEWAKKKRGVVEEKACRTDGVANAVCGVCFPSGFARRRNEKGGRAFIYPSTLVSSRQRLSKRTMTLCRQRGCASPAPILLEEGILRGKNTGIHCPGRARASVCPAKNRRPPIKSLIELGVARDGELRLIFHTRYARLEKPLDD
ncbi:hypothetical protein PYCCODRAFT_437741 [Trametes coccinea BRFM310]|uniref:Uncharacterized protein n=1 Tax=Trametes coccinea (strain BRFM310) TaxID=1353009 RepID=A0A1Y2IN27_TRAC3|nr:hypothetical protein PYCCODRAFT_437741 [Trametes coccinea BRFM310]